MWRVHTNLYFAPDLLRNRHHHAALNFTRRDLAWRHLVSDFLWRPTPAILARVESFAQREGLSDANRPAVIGVQLRWKLRADGLSFRDTFRPLETCLQYAIGNRSNATRFFLANPWANNHRLMRHHYGARLLPYESAPRVEHCDAPGLASAMVDLTLLARSDLLLLGTASTFGDVARALLNGRGLLGSRDTYYHWAVDSRRCWRSPPQASTTSKVLENPKMRHKAGGDIGGRFLPPSWHSEAVGDADGVNHDKDKG